MLRESHGAQRQVGWLAGPQVGWLAGPQCARGSRAQPHFPALSLTIVGFSSSSSRPLHEPCLAPSALQNALDKTHLKRVKTPTAGVRLAQQISGSGRFCRKNGLQTHRQSHTKRLVTDANPSHADNSDLSPKAKKRMEQIQHDFSTLSPWERPQRMHARQRDKTDGGPTLTTRCLHNKHAENLRN